MSDRVGSADRLDGSLASVSGPLRNRSLRAAMLCYHSVGLAGPPYLTVHPDTFERQLSVLRRLGCEAGGHDSLAALAGGARRRRPQVFMTFDDGYVDNYTHALPLLREYGFTAIVFIIPPFVDDAAPLLWPEVEHHVRAYPDVMRSVDWPMVEAMAAQGVEFGAHTLTHAHLPSLSDEELMQELLDSRVRVRERLGECRSIAYPFGDWDARVAAAAAAAGYEFAFTMPKGSQAEASLLSIPRVAVDHRDGARRFLLKLTPPARRLLLSSAKTWLRRLSAGDRAEAPR